MMSIETSFNPNATISFDMSPTPTRLYPDPIDLDAWLSLPAATLDGKSFDNRQVIKAIRNTRGSHSDRDLHPFVEMLRSTQSAVTGGTDHDLLVAYVHRVATVALALSQEILRNN